MNPADLGLGKIIETERSRDAIHIAVAPVTAAVRLFPGQQVGMDEAGAAPLAKTVGIVDPYLTVPVQPGQQFWLFLYPGSVTSLRHDWTHPAFALSETTRTETVGVDSRAWITEYAAIAGLTYDALMEAAKDFIDSDETYRLPSDIPNGLWEGREDFWHHYEAVTGTVVPADKKDDIFFWCWVDG